MLVSVLLFAVGLVLLIKGGDWFVDGATGLAKRFNLPDIVVGATVVSIGTTLPEVMVSTTGALQGSGAMAYGNAIGSIICNTALIAAISIFVNPGPVNVKSMKTPVIFFFASSAIYCLAAYGLGTFPRWLGLVMLTVFAIYMFLTVRNGMKNPDSVEEDEEESSKPKQLWQELLLLVVGAAVIAVGADLLVEHGQVIALGLGVPETVVAQSSCAIKGAILIKESGKTYSSARITLLEGNTPIEELNATGLSLTQGDTYDFAFTTPLPLQVGKECPFSVRVSLDNGAATYELKSSIKNLAFEPTKRVILEENTGMGCQNCPLGHLALEHLEHTYADRFIPIAYHTYTGDPLESGMTDYAQYFLTLTAAPTAMVQRNGTVSAPMVSVTQGGTTDYTFTTGAGDTWSDQVATEFAKQTDADLSIGTEYDEETDRLTVYYTLTSAIDRTDANIGLLCIVTEDAIAGYQSNAFYTASDPDLGAWGKGGAYAKSTVFPYTFNDVARALYPATSYYGQTGLLPTEMNHSVPNSGTIILRVAQDAPYVKDIKNCKVTCVAINVNTGRVINAARVNVGSSMTHINATDCKSLSVSATPEGIAIATATPVSVTLYSANGTHLATATANNKRVIPTTHRGLIIVRVQHEGGCNTYKVIR